MSTPTQSVSILLPVYNEAENLPELQQQIHDALESTDLTYEVVYVDDGSTDGSRDVLRRLAADDPHVKVVLFRRNFGQTAAMQAGIDESQYPVVIPLDADLQNDPSDIPKLLAKLDEGYDIVSGWREKRQENQLRRFPSMIANQLLVKITGIDIHDTGCTLKVYRREVLEPVRLYGQLHRFIPALASSRGARVAELPVKHHPRAHGESKYGIGRTTKVLCDLFLLRLLLGYPTRPLHAYGIWAIDAWIVSLLCGLIGLARIPAGAGGLWFVAAAVLLLGGGLLIGQGLLAELLVRIYHESTGKLSYRVEEVITGGAPAGS